MEEARLTKDSKEEKNFAVFGGGGKKFAEEKGASGKAVRQEHGQLVGGKGVAPEMLPVLSTNF